MECTVLNWKAICSHFCKGSQCSSEISIAFNCHLRHIQPHCITLYKYYSTTTNAYLSSKIVDVPQIEFEPLRATSGKSCSSSASTAPRSYLLNIVGIKTPHFLYNSFWRITHVQLDYYYTHSIMQQCACTNVDRISVLRAAVTHARGKGVDLVSSIYLGPPLYPRSGMHVWSPDRLFLRDVKKKVGLGTRLNFCSS